MSHIGPFMNVTYKKSEIWHNSRDVNFKILLRSFQCGGKNTVKMYFVRYDDTATSTYLVCLLE